MPIMPVVQVTSAADEGIDPRFRAEHDSGHTAVMHSKISITSAIMARRMDCSIFVKMARVWLEPVMVAKGSVFFTIASPTGEGLTNPRS